MSEQSVTYPELKKITPRDYQIEAYQSCVNAIRNYNGPFFVEASVGAGKTTIMAMLAARAQQLGWGVLILARRGELVEQNSETLWAAGVKNSIFSASVGAKSTHYPVIVGSEGTVARALDSELKSFAPMLCIIDECHETGYDNDDSQYMRILSAMSQRNPKMRIIGMTGSPYRGGDSILGELWVECVYRIMTTELVDRGFLVPTFFGYESQHQGGYDLSAWQTPDSDRHSDYTAAELLAMQRTITADETKTQQIMAEVVELTRSRNVVMITGAGKKHLQQIADCLPAGSWVIITDSTPSGERRDMLKAIGRGEKKYLLQIGCLTTGFDAPLVDTSVIMRKIGSLTLLIQLLGRGMRLLKDEHREAGFIKHNHLVLDYSDTMAEMAERYENPILEKSQLQKSKRDQTTIICPACDSINSKFARRCVHRPDDPAAARRVMVGTVENYSIDGRCEFFWSARTCPHCNTQNDQAARECRKCAAILIDPNANLQGKHYTDDDFREVVKMHMRLTKSGESVIVDYFIRSIPNEHDKAIEIGGESLVVAREILHPTGRERWAKGPWFEFLKKHLHKSWHDRAIGKPASYIVKNQAMFSVPTYITHRTRPDGKSIIHRKKFISGESVN